MAFLIFINFLLVIMTGGVWLIVLIIWYILKSISNRRKIKMKKRLLKIVYFIAFFAFIIMFLQSCNTPTQYETDLTNGRNWKFRYWWGINQRRRKSGEWLIQMEIITLKLKILCYFIIIISDKIYGIGGEKYDRKRILWFCYKRNRKQQGKNSF